MGKVEALVSVSHASPTEDRARMVWLGYWQVSAKESNITRRSVELSVSEESLVGLYVIDWPGQRGVAYA